MIAALVVVGLVNAWALAYGSSRVLGAVLVRWDKRLSLDERRVAIEEATDARRTKSSVVAVIPPDLMRRITRWQDEIAQEAERSNLLAIFADVGDWDKVRAVLPPEPSEEYASPLIS